MYPKIPLCLLVKIVLCFDSLIYIFKKKKKKKKKKKIKIPPKSEWLAGMYYASARMVTSQLSHQIILLLKHPLTYYWTSPLRISNQNDTSNFYASPPPHFFFGGGGWEVDKNKQVHKVLSPPNKWNWSW